MGETQDKVNPKASVSAADSTSTARRTVNWATNLLATGIIIIGSLVFGRQVLQWWGQRPIDSPQVSKRLGPEIGSDPTNAPILRFGESSATLQRVDFDGNRRNALVVLRQLCRPTAALARLPDRRPGPSEKRLLERVDKLQPTESEAGKWRLFQLDGPVPLVVVVSVPSEEDRGEHPGRVVSWGLGVHLSGTRWTLFTLASSDTTPSSDRNSTVLPVPHGSKRTMSLHASGPQQMAGFRVEGTVEHCIVFYEKAMREQGWASSITWKQLGTHWHARYLKQNGETLDIQLVKQIDGKVLGLLSVTNMPQETKEN